ncbi:DNA-binding transcriptional LysR family regulator [Bradyrhizobium sp. AZCC 1578]|uniref:LysR substrate-binding domain-containing protein n=1 Tax=unclassified Bradyrhizobium TaxID=2631580 RepID=UPI002FEEC4F7
MRRLPSLNGLRAFEAAARHGSFVGASQELNVTQAAVSRMVRLLEARLGLELFQRLPNGLALTAQAKALQPSLTAAFDSIAASVEQVAAMRTTPVLTIGVGPSFAVRWMIPRLASFYGTHPDIEVRLATGGAINPFKDDWTCGILLGNGDWPGLAAEPLFSADLFPVCTAATARRLGKPSDLANENLLQVVHSPEDWPLWLAAAGVKLRRKALGPSFANYGMALQAALDGVGVAIGLRPYVEDDLAMRRLVAPFAISVPKGQAWYLVYRPFRETDPGLIAFRDWLRRSFQASS